MEEFWKGFEKRAQSTAAGSDSSPSPLAVGAGTSAAYLAAHNARRSLQDFREGRIQADKSVGSFQSKLKPGDVFLSRSPRKNYDNLKFRVGGGKPSKLPLKAVDAYRLGAGDIYHHAGVYLGNGKVIHTGGQGDDTYIQKLHEAVKGDDVKVYRFAKGEKEQQAAAGRARKLKGLKYHTDKTLASYPLKTSLGLGATPNPGACVRKGERILCTNVATRAHPNIFSKQDVSHADIRANRKGSMVARFNQAGKPQAIEHLVPRVVWPAIRSLRYAVPAAALAYAGSKLMGSRKDS